MFSEFIANDKPIVFTKDGELFLPVFVTYTEKDLGGVLDTEAAYKDSMYVGSMSHTVGLFGHRFLFI